MPQPGPTPHDRHPLSRHGYLGDLPLLHTWDGGKTWNTGGFSASQLVSIHDISRAAFGDRPLRIIETGAGNSTITFLHLDLDRLVTIAPSADLRDRIVAYCGAHGIDTARLDYRVNRSEIELPSMACVAADRPRFDVALIDGGHGWPTVFVDFCYLNLMMPAGGLLFLDDLQLYSVAELSRLLEQQPGFELAHDLDKLQVWRKTDDEPFLPEHSREPYIVERTRAVLR